MGSVNLANKQETIGTSAVQLNSGTSLPSGRVLLKAHPDNTGRIFIGGASTVTTSGATGGIPLSAGESHFFDGDNINRLWAIASASSQILCWLTQS